MSYKGIWFILILCLCITVSANASMITYDFYQITNSTSTNVAEQLSVALTNENCWDFDTVLSSKQVAFVFKNDVDPELGISSNVTEIYFDDGPFLEISKVVTDGTTFSQPNKIKPGNLPDGKDLKPAFTATVSFSIDSDHGQGSDGLDDED